MGGGYLSNAVSYLINVIFGLYIGAVMVRFLLQLVRADFYYNPLAKALVTITNPALRPLRRLIPGFQGIDWAAVVLMLFVQMAETTIIVLMIGHVPVFQGLVVVAIAELLSIAIYIYQFAILIQVVLSWIAPDQYNPITEVVDALAEPLLRPARQMIPPLGGLDFSPFAALILLQLTSMLVVAPLRDFGYRLL
jgi:YggT family protein